MYYISKGFIDNTVNSRFTSFTHLIFVSKNFSNNYYKKYAICKPEKLRGIKILDFSKKITCPLCKKFIKEAA